MTPFLSGVYVVLSRKQIDNNGVYGFSQRNIAKVLELFRLLRLQWETSFTIFPTTF